MTSYHGADLPTALFQLTVLLLGATLAWAALVALLATWKPTKRLAMALTPRVIRAAAFTTVSGTLAIAPAHAGDLDGLPYPDRGVTSAPSAPSTPSDPIRADLGHHVVQAGESLWTIAAETLPPDADPARVATASAEWYRTNRAIIGPDPNLILPGQTLAAPEGEVLP